MRGLVAVLLVLAVLVAVARTVSSDIGKWERAASDTSACRGVGGCTPVPVHGTPGAGSPDEPATGTGVTITAPVGGTGRGALARRLPATFRGWRFSIAQISARGGVYVVTAIPSGGRRATAVAAKRALAGAARSLNDDSRLYRLLVPMSTLAGAHRRGPRR